MWEFLRMITSVSMKNLTWLDIQGLNSESISTTVCTLAAPVVNNLLLKKENIVHPWWICWFTLLLDSKPTDIYIYMIYIIKRFSVNPLASQILEYINTCKKKVETSWWKAKYLVFWIYGQHILSSLTNDKFTYLWKHIFYGLHKKNKQGLKITLQGRTQN